MAASKINMKQISEDLKSYLTNEMEINVKKITEKIIGKVDNKGSLPNSLCHAKHQFDVRKLDPPPLPSPTKRCLKIHESNMKT